METNLLGGIIFIFMSRLFLFLLSVVLWSVAFSDVPRLDELERLKSMISDKATIDKAKFNKVNDLKAKLAKTHAHADKVKILNELGDEYTLFMADSATHFYNEAIELCQSVGDSTGMYMSIMKKIRPETIAGFYAEAINEFNILSERTLPDSLLPHYYECGYRLYSFTLNSIERHNIFYDQYFSKASEFRQLWIASLPAGSVMRDLYEAESLFVSGKYNAAKVILRELLGKLTEKSNEYAISSAIMANILRAEGNIPESLRYYALSATADIECSVKENQSIYELSMILYELGDIETSYRFILASIEDAAFCNAQMRVYNASRMLPVIEEAHQKDAKRHERIMVAYLIVVSLLVLGLVLVVFILVRQMRKLSRARAKLHAANNIKDEYMGQFLELCTVYIKRLDSFTKLVTRKLTSGQVEDLLRLTRSARFNDEQHREFYKAFDLAFLKIYTTFVDDVNALLRPEERYTIETPGTLNNELRIYALIRLGINDGQKIAEFLKYSVNTIYTYRNRIKNKAINRETFEDDVMNIGVIE